MNKLTLEQKLRSGHVKRWQIIRVAREQSLAEHLYRVYLISCEITDILRLDDETNAYVRKWALMHDLPEVVTGDVATPVKRILTDVIDDYPSKIEYNIDLEYAYVHTKISESYSIVLDVVKLADLLEAIIFLKTEGIGEHARKVENNLRAKFNEKLAECEIKHSGRMWSKIKHLQDIEL